jgi:hypothetical protein
MHEQLSKEISSISPNSIVPFLSEGRWSLYHLLSFILSITGPAEVKISSFSLSEAAIRVFLQEIQTGSITGIKLLLDTTIPSRKLDLTLFASNVIKEIRLIPNHSKLVLVKNSTWSVVVVSSQNLTPNPRLESGVIFTTQEHFDFFNSKFDEFYSKAVPLIFE